MSEIFNKLMSHEKSGVSDAAWVLLKEAALHIAHLEAAILQQRGEIDGLNTRLENNFAFRTVDDVMTRIVVVPGTIPDGIECRDETIRLQDKYVKELEAEIGPLRAKAALHDKQQAQIEDKNAALFKAAERFRLTWESNDSRLKLAMAEDDKERQSYYHHKVEMYADLLAECLAAATG